jgi:hypothetical protein
VKALEINIALDVVRFVQVQRLRAGVIRQMTALTVLGGRLKQLVSICYVRPTVRYCHSRSERLSRRNANGISNVQEYIRRNRIKEAIR